MENFIGVELWLFVFAVTMDLFLSFVVLRNDHRSATNKVFAILGLIVASWIIVNYLSVHPWSQEVEPLLIKLTLFLATPMNFLFWVLAAILPRDRMAVSRWSLVPMMALTAFVMWMVMSPYTIVSSVGGNMISGPGIAVFGIFSIGSNLAAIITLVRRFRKSEGDARRQIWFVMQGTIWMFGLIVPTVFLPFVVLGLDAFVPFFPLYTIFFLGFTSYAIVRHHLFSFKTVAAEAFAILLVLLLLAKTLIAENNSQRITELAVLIAVFVASILLVRSIRREVKQREELEDLTGQLGRVNAELTEVGKFKSQLLSIASHQIKSPLAIMKGYLTLIREGSYGETDVRMKPVLRRMETANNDLITLIEDLLNLRRAEEGKLDYDFKKTDLRDLASNVFEIMSTVASKKKLEFTFERPGEAYFINADTTKLTEVIRNLVDNAIKYTATGYVRISMRKESFRAILSVEDSGLGMPADLIPKLFGEFVRDERVRAKIQGSGFGLYVARKITEAHGGKVIAESDGPGKGSRFTLSLPLMPS